MNMAMDKEVSIMWKALLSAGFHRALMEVSAARTAITEFTQPSHTRLLDLFTLGWGHSSFRSSHHRPSVHHDADTWDLCTHGPSEVNKRFTSMNRAGYSAVLSQDLPDHSGERAWGVCGWHQTQPPLPKIPNHGSHLPTWQ